MWQCNHCTLVNEDSSSRECMACGLPRGASPDEVGVAIDLTGDTPTLSGGARETSSDGARCQYDSDCRRRDPNHFAEFLHVEEWICPTCTVRNVGVLMKCSTCEGYRGPPLVENSATAGKAEIMGDFVQEIGDEFEPFAGLKRCPVQTCRVELMPAEYGEHVQIHLVAGDDVDGDAELSRLRKRYGLDPDPDNASYSQQFEKRLQAQVAKGKMTSADAAAKLQEMRAAMEHGESASTTGIIPHVISSLSWIHRNDGRTQQSTLSGSVASTIGSASGTASVSRNSARGESASVRDYGRGTSWVVCGESAVHCGGDLGDSGWGCGYRNIQMQCGYLLSCGGDEEGEFRAALFAGTGILATVPKLQEWLEAAWRAGFDRDGATQLEHFIANTKKLIGATECATLLRSFGVRARVCDFISPRLPRDEYDKRRQQAELDAHHDNMRHPNRKKQKKAKYVSPYAPCTELAEFCWKYFVARQQPGQKATGFCPPLYLQHEGHSRTVIGAEREEKSGAITLLLFDPSQPGPAILRDVREKRRLQRLRRGTHTLTQGKYQVVWVEQGIARGAELDDLKIIAGERNHAVAWNRRQVQQQQQ